VKRTKEGSEGEGGRKDPTSTSLACEGGGSLSTTRGRGIKARPFKNSLLGVCWVEKYWEVEALKACKVESLEDEDEDGDESVSGKKEVNGRVAISDWGLNVHEMCL